MTTIAYRDGILACDTRCNWNDLITSESKYLILEKSVFGISGCVPNAILFTDWVYNGMNSERLPKIDHDNGFHAIEINRETLNIYHWYAPEIVRCPINTEYDSIGTGGSVAIGAMAMGASALKAVQIASKHDIHTGGPFDVIEVKSGIVTISEV